MITDDLRKAFMMIIGESYDRYGYPEYCGWIEGLMLLEQKEWSQRSLSKRLREIFPESKYPTSVPSINRALKTLESYGVVERAGSRKTGYQYRLLTSSNLITTMLQQFQIVNQEFIRKLKNLEKMKKTNDSELNSAIAYQIKMAEVWNNAIEKLMKIGDSES